MSQLFIARCRNRLIKLRFRGKELHPLARANLKALDHIGARQYARGLRYVIFDIETTGLSLQHDRVVSVGAYRVVDGRIALGDVFSSLVSPGRDIPSAAVKIHGIIPSMVDNAPSFSEVFEKFTAYLGTDILVGYHVEFDLHFLNVYMRKTHGFPVQNLVLDAQPLCRSVGFPPHLRSYAGRLRGHRDLDTAARHFGIEIQERHTALGDALATAMIFQRILTEFEKSGPGRLKNLLAASRSL
ncbi:MAG: 3'-5' exonuclease [Desulfobacterales bacterium]